MNKQKLSKYVIEDMKNQIRKQQEPFAATKIQSAFRNKRAIDQLSTKYLEKI